MSSSPLAELPKLGQSVWYDQMQRSLALDGHLQRMIDQDDLRGLTSNPTIFEKAIGGTREYDATLERLAAEGKTADEMYEAIVLEDIALASDVFSSVYERTGALDGYCSLEVSPRLAHDTQGTVLEGLKLFGLLGRDNVMIKVPATPEGIPAIEELIYEGVNVNVTLIFSREVYARVIDAYMRGLERRVEQQKPVDRVASVASFFVSRIDSKVDAQLDKRIAGASSEDRAKLESLKGTIAIANAKAAYQLFKSEFGSERFIRLRNAGAMVQRPLWASTGTKNPAYSDVLYVESLIGADTVNTVPPATYDAFRDHGTVQPTIEQGVDEAMRELALLDQMGISLAAITEELTAEGVKSFADSFGSLMRTIEVARAAALRARTIAVREHPGAEAGGIEDVLKKASAEKWVDTIWRKDASFWKDETAHRTLIGNSLGWLTVPEQMSARLEEVEEFVAEARKKFAHVVVLGMGGSSLCSEVIRTVVGRREGWPQLHVLDSTVPESVRALERLIDLDRTLFIVASKSGTTTEPSMFMRYFFERVRGVRGDRAGEQFVAITDPGTKLEQEAKEAGFARTFVNWADIGGRYSALSMFGIVPAALAGADVREILARASNAAVACRASSGQTRNPGLRLGAFMGALAAKGIDKLTLLLPHRIEAFGLWVEQLVAESTGKEGRGILPIAGEPLQKAEDYSHDRAFLSIRTRDRDEEIERLTRDLAAAGRPVYEIAFSSPEDLGDLFFTFEFATAVAGRILGVNPFDQPNVQESKSNTASALERVRAGTSPFHGGAPLSLEESSSREQIAEFLRVPRKGYLAVLAYIDDNEGHRELLRHLRANVLSAGAGVATTAGFGPRYLHSTGQLHKGGAEGGRYLVLTAEPVEDVPIPGESFGFGALAHAQAAGDIASLRARDREVLHVHLAADTYDALRSLTAVTAGAGSRGSNA